jgi:hypothetical protein
MTRLASMLFLASSATFLLGGSQDGVGAGIEEAKEVPIDITGQVVGITPKGYIEVRSSESTFMVSPAGIECTGRQRGCQYDAVITFLNQTPTRQSRNQNQALLVVKWR